MTNFRINFLYPWFLLLLIPAFALALILYFRISKRYRRTRNRIVSMVLYFIVSTLSILTLSGIHFTYEVPNLETEVILLVDASYSGRKAEEKKNQFIQEAIRNSKDVCQIGVVTFGYGEPVYAVPLTTDVSGAYTQYLAAEKPDVSATDLATALTYAKDLFKNKEVAKIVVISDGLETDGKAAVAVKEVAAEGIEVNAVYLSGEKPNEEIQIVGIITPDYNVNVGDVFKITVQLRSSYEGAVEFELFDNGVSCSTKIVNVIANNGVQEVELEHSVSVPELHALSVKVSGGTDECAENNTYQGYMYIETYTKILMLERNVGESEAFKTLLQEENELFEIETVNVFDKEKIDTLDEIRQFDQVVLVNIANADMPEGFIDILYTYVNDIGGGLLTVGGNQVDENGNVVVDARGEVVANAYNREDMYGTLYQEMLPVQAIDYTPPVAVMLVIDRSGSMEMPAGQSGKTKLDLAKEGAKACLNALTERDYCGILTLEEKYTEEMRVQPMTQMAKLQASIDGIVTGGGTVFQDALAGAGKALQAVQNVERRHVILVTDGVPSDGVNEYGIPVDQYYNDPQKPVTFSFVIIGEDISASDKNYIRYAAEELGGGRFYDVSDVNSLPRIMREELNMKEIKAINHEPFQPKIDTYNNVVSGIQQIDIPQLNGFYGTKLKSGAEMSLKGEFVPIYAHWKYGEGMVGSFMCDLNNVWSPDFMANATGRRILMNIVNSLFPTKNIRPMDIDVALYEENYDTSMSVYTKLNKGERIELQITSPDGNGDLTQERTITPSEDEGYSRISFSITQPGVHRLTVKKRNENGDLLAETVLYKTFSYSEEYNMFYDPEDGKALLESIAVSGQGQMITDSFKIYQEIEKSLKRTYDPRLPFIITALVLFLLDIAVRKFKFKWPHELIRDAKAKKLLEKKGK